MTKYGCYDRPVAYEGQTQAQDGWRADGIRRMKAIPTKWLPIRCGHLTRDTDALCAGCSHRAGVPL